MVSKTGTPARMDFDSSRPPHKEMADLEAYVYSDFRPIDFTTYESKLPFSCSALPLLCHSIAFDITEGIANAQFSVHLLAHLLPFFFDFTTKVVLQPGCEAPDSLAERLMRPDLSQRIIEGLFLNHYLYLKRVKLFKPMTELRNTCEGLGLGYIFKLGASDDPVGTSLIQDPFQVQVSCNRCHSLMQPNSDRCTNCGAPRAMCPICQQVTVRTPKQDICNETKIGRRSLWAFCQACGHGAHWTCMQEWMSQPDAEGGCPTRGCGCDCGPGTSRLERIARQVLEAESAEIIRGGRTSSATKRDPLRASHSPAVDKTRDTLRNSDWSKESGGEERSRRSFSGRGGSSRGVSGTNGGVSRGINSGFGRRVRLLTPGEEDETSQSAA